MEIVAETRVQSLRTRGTTDNTRNLYGALKYSFLTLAKFSRNKTIHFQSGIVQLYPLSLAHTGVLRCILSGYDPYKPPPPESSSDASLCSANRVAKITHLCKSDSFVLKDTIRGYSAKSKQSWANNLPIKRIK